MLCRYAPTMSLFWCSLKLRGRSSFWYNHLGYIWSLQRQSKNSKLHFTQRYSNESPWISVFTIYTNGVVCFPVCPGQHSGIPSTCSRTGRAFVGYFCKRSHSAGVSYWWTDEIQVRLQIQGDFFDAISNKWLQLHSVVAFRKRKVPHEFVTLIQSTILL